VGVGGLGVSSDGGGSVGSGDREREDAEGDEREEEGGRDKQRGERDGVGRYAAAARGEDARRADPAHERARRRRHGMEWGQLGGGRDLALCPRPVQCSPFQRSLRRGGAVGAQNRVLRLLRRRLLLVPVSTFDRINFTVYVCFYFMF
jgi:hypothetical protein